MPGETVVETVEVPVNAQKTVVEFWTTDNEEARVKVYEEVARAIWLLTPALKFALSPLKKLVSLSEYRPPWPPTACPTIVRMGIERVASFSADGLLDEDAAMATIEAIGESDFRKGPLQMVDRPGHR